MKTFRAIFFFFSILILFAISSPSKSGEATAGLDSADQVRTYAQLHQKADQNGAVRVIVSLNIPFQPEGELAGAAVNAQRTAIAQAQNDLLASLSSEQISAIKQFKYQPGIAISVSPQALEKLHANPNVASIVEDRLAKVSLSESVPLIGATPDKTHGFTGAGWAVAILDTGVDKTHPFLAGKVISEACYSTTSYVYGSTSVCPSRVESSILPGSGINCGVNSDCDHGTHVAGIAAGKGSSMTGVARDASIIAIQVFSKITDPVFCKSYYPCIASYTSDQILGLERVYELRNTYHIAAVNMSLGGGKYYDTSTCDEAYSDEKIAIDDLRSANIATVIASGNNEYDDALSAPGCISSAISVASTKDGSYGATPADTVSSFSNSASFLTLLAPGEWITSSIPRGGYATWEGTSMATPHVTGAFAVVNSSHYGATLNDILGALTDTGKPVFDSRNGITKPRIQVDAAINYLGPDPLPTVNIENAAYSFSEGAGQAVINVVLSDQIASPVSVNYSTSDGTANAGSDYTATSGTLTFQPGETSKAISILVTQDTINELDETFNVTLSAPTFSILGSQSSTVITIQDDDVVTVQFVREEAGICKGAGGVSIDVGLSIPAAQTVTVQYATSDDTAIAGTDYISANRTLNYAPGDMSNTIEINLLDDGTRNGTKTFHITLSDPTVALLGFTTIADIEMRDYCVFIPLKDR